MAKFGRVSRSRLEGVHPIMVDWSLRVVAIFNCSVVSGVRTIATQTQYVAIGASKTMNSKHLIQEDGYGHALDLAPYPIDWDKLHNFYVLGGIGIAIAHEMGVPITWGGDWDRDLDVYDQDFNDLGHFQIEIPYYTTRPV